MSNYHRDATAIMAIRPRTIYRKCMDASSGTWTAIDRLNCTRWTGNEMAKQSFDRNASSERFFCEDRGHLRATDIAQSGGNVRPRYCRARMRTTIGHWKARLSREKTSTAVLQLTPSAALFSSPRDQQWNQRRPESPLFDFNDRTASGTLHDPRD
ncbi:hypothetical protein VSR82_36085 [Burkholderia sp. JPY481]